MRRLRQPVARSFDNAEPLRCSELGKKRVALFDGHYVILIAVNDEDGTGNFSRSFRCIEDFEVIEERNIEAAAMILGESPCPPLPRLFRS